MTISHLKYKCIMGLFSLLLKRFQMVLPERKIHVKITIIKTPTCSWDHLFEILDPPYEPRYCFFNHLLFSKSMSIQPAINFKLHCTVICIMTTDVFLGVWILLALQFLPFLTQTINFQYIVSFFFLFVFVGKRSLCSYTKQVFPI